MSYLILKPEYKKLSDEWEDLYGDSGCSCSACSLPPCGWCESSGTHDGNPIALEDNPDAWFSDLESEIIRQSNKGADYD